MMLTLDLILLTKLLIEILSPSPGETTFKDWGWVFLLVYPGLPIISPVLAFFSALRKDADLMKEMINVNSVILTVNLPLSIIGCLAS